jgi:cyclopropane-fatty-acyl-phospholipid synthase
MGLAHAIAERGYVPDFLVRREIRRLVRDRLRDERRGTPAARAARFAALIEALGRSPVALHTDAANAQHYEVPTEFFAQVLGRHLKYSACLWDDDTDDLDVAEANMLELYAARAQLSDGQRILDLGCGWGSFSLWAAHRYPAARFTAVSNSRTQRAFIEQQAKRHGLTNLTVVTADANALDFPAQSFDRVVSVEMFEHVRNYQALLERISRWLAADGKLFVHIFCHRQLMYPFETEGDDDWMGRHFFTGGLMPAANTLAHFQQHLHLDEHWALSGRHYQRTAAAWLARMDAKPREVRAALALAYGDDVDLWVQRWRFFFMACEEMFGYGDGDEWQVCHYLLSHPPSDR